MHMVTDKNVEQIWYLTVEILLVIHDSASALISKHSCSYLMFSYQNGLRKALPVISKLPFWTVIIIQLTLLKMQFISYLTSYATTVIIRFGAHLLISARLE